MPKKTPINSIQREAQAAFNEALNAPWAIESSALLQIMNDLQALAEGRVSAESMGTDRGASKMEVRGGVAYIPIAGPIRPRSDFYTKYFGATACTDLARDLDVALNSENVTEIAFLVDSPGGSVSQVEETAQKIFEARGRKPMTAYVVGMCASAAYYLASAADKIVAQPSSLTGSIGTVIMHADYSKQLEEFYGVKVTPVHFGSHKVDANPYQPLDAQGKATLQELVDAFGNQFISAVAKHRGTTPKGVQDGFGQGKVYVADEALKRGLIDALGEVKGGETSPAPQSALAQSGEEILTSARSAQPLTEKKPVKKLKALMFGLSLIASHEATDETVEAALTGYCSAKGIDVPRNDKGEIVEADAIKLLNASTNRAQAAKDQEIAEAQAMTAQAYKKRRDDIESIAALVNQTREVVTADVIRSAVDSDQSIDAIRADWTQRLTASSAQPLRQYATANGTTSSREEKWAETAVASMLNQCGMGPVPQGGFGDLGGISLTELAAESLSMTTGQRRSVHRSNSEDVASQALQAGNYARHNISAGEAYNRPGDFPHLMSVLANKVLSGAMELSEATFDKYTQRMADADDFKPSTVVGVGSFDMIDEIKDGEDYKELAMAEELKGWIAIKRRGNIVKLTPVMVANNDLDSFVTQLQSLAFAHDNALNYLCLSVLTSNALMPDGYALFSAEHANLVSSGAGVPSAAQAKLMRQTHRRMKGVGTNKTLRSRPRVVLVPTSLEDDAIQTYAPFGSIPEMKVPTTDTTINVHRGSAEVVVEPDLEYFSTAYWYTVDTRIRSIVHRFMAGYGRGGKRESWYDQNNGCRNYSLEGRFSAAAVDFRGIARNNGG